MQRVSIYNVDNFCSLLWRAGLQFRSQIRTNGDPFCPYSDHKVLNEFRIWGIFFDHGSKISMISEPLYCFCLVICCFIMLEIKQITTKLCLNCWEKLLLEKLLIAFLIHASDFGQNCEWAHFLGWWATPRTVGLGMLPFFSCTGLTAVFTFSAPDSRFSRCSKQSEGGNNFALVFCCPFCLWSLSWR